MFGARRRRADPTDEWEQIELLCLIIAVSELWRRPHLERELPAGLRVEM